MDKRSSVTIVTMTAIVTAMSLAPVEAFARPNVVVVITDDQGYGDFGFTGNPIVRTPNLDAMAGRSARMTDFYVSPVCAPTRASLMTGRYNYRTRVRDTYIGRAMMDPDELTLAEILREDGYATGIFGKWHLGDNYPMRAMDQGFEEALVHRGGGIGQPCDPPGGEGKYTDPILFHNGEQKQFEGYCTDLFFDHAMRFMRGAKQEGRPFFAYIATNAPHGPYHDPPRELYEQYLQRDCGSVLQGENIDRRLADGEGDRTASIFAMIENIDQNVGRLFEALRMMEALENTLVIFMQDNGANGNRYAKGFREFKGSVYEGGVRSVFWAHWPGRFQAGRSSDRVAAHIDVMPTILDACGIAPPTDRAIDGRSLLPLLVGGQVDWPDRMIVVQWHRGDVPQRYRHFAARTQRWKLLDSGGVGEAWREGPPQFELYDLWSDPFERRNLADERPKVLADLQAQYDAWFDDVSATREDNWASTSIHLGTSHENPVTLTRQEWQHREGAPWGANSQGFWRVHVAAAGRYDFVLRFQRPFEKDGKATVKVGDAAWSVAVQAGARGCEIVGATLTRGDAELWTLLEDGGGQRGALQVDVRRAE